MGTGMAHFPQLDVGNDLHHKLNERNLSTENGWIRSPHDCLLVKFFIKLEFVKLV